MLYSSGNSVARLANSSVPVPSQRFHGMEPRVASTIKDAALAAAGLLAPARKG
jgi:hypothetical protein